MYLSVRRRVTEETVMMLCTSKIEEVLKEKRDCAREDNCRRAAIASFGRLTAFAGGSKAEQDIEGHYTIGALPPAKHTLLFL